MINNIEHPLVDVSTLWRPKKKTLVYVAMQAEQRKKQGVIPASEQSNGTILNQSTTERFFIVWEGYIVSISPSDISPKK